MNTARPTTIPADAAAPTSEADIVAMAERLARMEKFMTRRFDEISAEIHATCQMLDMAENGISSRFAEVLGVLSAISFHGDGASPHNVGIELDAVVKTTEDAANRILDATDEIAQLVNGKTEISWDNPQERAEKLNKINELTNTILTACAFQDLTGQRIGKTLEKIRKAEAELSETLKKMGVNIELEKIESKAAEEVRHERAATQGEVDSLFS